MRSQPQVLLGIAIISVPLGILLLFVPTLQPLGVLMLLGGLASFALFLYLDWGNYETYIEQRRRGEKYRNARYDRKSERTMHYLEAFVRERMDRANKEINPEDEWGD